MPANAKPDPSTLSLRQRRILEVINDAVLLRGYPPSIREIGDASGLQSTSSVAYQLKELEKKGFLRRDPNKPRAVDVRHLPDSRSARAKSEAKKQQHQPDPTTVGSFHRVPMVGRIAAGSPILAEQNVENYFSVPEELTADGELYILQVQGDSMEDIGILENDWVVVRSQPTVEEGEIVVAMIDGEATVKCFHQDSTGVWLIPKNKNYLPINGNEATILGKVISLMRRF